MKLHSWTVEAFTRLRTPYTVDVLPGFTLIEGENRDWAGLAESNASGKSLAIPETLYWGLTGRMLRYGDRPATDGAADPHDGARVIVRANGLVVTRSRTAKGSPKLSITQVDGTPVVSSRDPDRRTDEVAEVLGVDARALRMAVIVTDAEHFTRADYADQIAAIESLLRLDEFADAQKRVEQESRNRALLVESARAKVEVAQATASATQRDLDVANLEMARMEQPSTLPTQRAAAQEAAEALPGLRQVVESHSATLVRVGEGLVDLTVQHGRLAGTLQEIDRDLARTVCPTCGRPWEKAAQKAQLHEKREAVKAEIQHGLTQKQAAYTERQRAAGDLRTAEQTVEQAVRLSGQIPVLDQALAAEADARARAQQRVLAAETVKDRARDEVEAVSVRLAEVVAQYDRAAFWAKGFGRAGLPARVVAQALPVLNQAAARHAQTLTGGQIGLTFHPVKESRTDPVIRLTGTSAPSFMGLSRGERGRVGVILALAFRDLARWRLPEEVNVVIFDEVFDGLDQAGLSRIVFALKEDVARGVAVFIVTHNPALRGLVQAAGARTIRVVREGGKATVEGGGVQ